MVDHVKQYKIPKEYFEIEDLEEKDPEERNDEEFEGLDAEQIE